MASFNEFIAHFCSSFPDFRIRLFDVLVSLRFIFFSPFSLFYFVINPCFFFFFFFFPDFFFSKEAITSNPIIPSVLGSIFPTLSSLPIPPPPTLQKKKVKGVISQIPQLDPKWKEKEEKKKEERKKDEVFNRAQNLSKLLKVLVDSLCDSFQFDEQSSLCVVTDLSFTPTKIQSTLVNVCTAMLEVASLETLEVFSNSKFSATVLFLY